MRIKLTLSDLNGILKRLSGWVDPKDPREEFRYIHLVVDDSLENLVAYTTNGNACGRIPATCEADEAGTLFLPPMKPLSVARGTADSVELSYGAGILTVKTSTVMQQFPVPADRAVEFKKYLPDMEGADEFWVDGNLLSKALTQAGKNALIRLRVRTNLPPVRRILEITTVDGQSFIWPIAPRSCHDHAEKIKILFDDTPKF